MVKYINFTEYKPPTDESCPFSMEAVIALLEAHSEAGMTAFYDDGTPTPNRDLTMLRIHQLRQQLAKPSDWWISVDDRLPEFLLFSGEPLVVGGNEIPPLYRSERVLYLVSGVTMCGKLDRISDRIVPYEVTHWQPLPAPPKATPDNLKDK